MPKETRIMVVDDNEDLTRIVSLILTAEGFNVTTCNSLSESYSILNSFKPNLLLLDLNIGNEDGSQLCRSLQEDGTSDTKVILMSGDEALFPSLIADDYITKPFDTAQLIDKIYALVSEGGNYYPIEENK